MGDMYEKLRAKIAMMKNEIYRMRGGEGRVGGAVCQAGHPFRPVGRGSGAFNTPFKFIMTFYSLCRVQHAEQVGAGNERGGRGRCPLSSLISSESCSKFLRISA